jgi:hypothetical protein
VIYDDVVSLIGLIDRFAGGDTSQATAGEIEGLVLECFPDEAWFENVSLALALYVPGGSGHYYDAVAVIQELNEARSTLSAEWVDPCD